MLSLLLALASSSQPFELALVVRIAAPATSTITALDLEQAASSAARWFVDLSVVPTDRMRQMDHQLRACGMDDRCLAAQLERAGIERALYVSANLGDRAGLVSVEVVDTQRSTVIATEAVEIASEIDRLTGDAVRRALLAAGHRLGGRLTIEVDPPTAAMRIPTGTIAIGSSVLLTGGMHLLIAEADGFVTDEREIAVEPGSDTRLKIELEETGVVRKWWFWAILGGVVAAAAAGAALAVAFAPRAVEGCHFHSNTCD